MSSYSLRRCARPISWSDGAFSHRRKITWHKLLVHGRLRGPRLLLCRNSVITCCSEGNISLNCCLVSLQFFLPKMRETCPQFHFQFHLFRCDTRIGSQFCVETMKVDKLHKFMAFMTNAFESMEMPTFGNILLTFSITCHWLLL